MLIFNANSCNTDKQIQLVYKPSGCIAILDTHLQLVINFLLSSCFNKLYTRTNLWV